MPIFHNSFDFCKVSKFPIAPLDIGVGQLIAIVEFEGFCGAQLSGDLCVWRALATRSIVHPSVDVIEKENFGRNCGDFTTPC